MSVVFDEVVTQVETPPQPPETQHQESGERESPQHEAYCWQQHQSTFQRRQLRLEAD